MKGFGIASAVAALSMLVSSVNAQVDPIVIKGSKFFYKTNGTQFYMRGVAYQQDVTSGNTSSTDYSDPLANAAACKRDLPYLIQLRTNVIRVYAVDPTQDHSACMNMFANAGIYVISDLSQPGLSINRATPEWNDELYARYTSVVDSLQNYTNTLGFFAGNEVSNQANNTDASAFVKAAVRDTKAYIKAKGYRTIGVGYATNDDASIRLELADYFNCGTDTSAAIDFWGYNIYSWCGDSSYVESGYNLRTQEFSNYSVPAFFAEYGCNTVEPRTFSEVDALFGANMSSVWSGGIVYMYFQETNNYGLVTVSGNSVSTLTDFSYLSSRLATVSPTGVNSASYTPSNNPQACPTIGADWDAKATPLPPSPNQALCSCMYNSLSCVVKGSVNSSDYGTLFSTVCGLDNGTPCNGIAANATTGVYGAYSMCNSTEQLAYVLNAYYQAQASTNKASACNFGGSASTKSATSAAGTCSALIAQAGTAGTGSVTSSPTAASAASGSGSKSTSSSTSTSSKGAGSSVSVPAFEFGLFNLGLYVCGAVLSGGAMILL